MERKRLPAERLSITHKFRVGGIKGYLTIGLYEDNTPGEIFIRIAKEGSTLMGVLDSFAVMMSLALQYGVPLEIMIKKLRGVHFEPFGVTGSSEVPTAASIIDYIFRWLELKFVANKVEVSTPAPSPSE